MVGKLYGVGVGPGDPRLLTLYAKEILENCDVVAYPVSKPGENSTAFRIASEAVDLSEKSVEEFLFEMNPDDGVREKCRSDAIDKMCKILDQGETIAMVSLGDISVYSTFTYIATEVRARGYETEIIPGIPSFCHGAAVANVPLMIGNEGLAIVPVAKDNTALLHHSMEKFDNIVVMKANKYMPQLILAMMNHGFSKEGATVISNVGMEGEYVGPIDLDREYGYFTTVILKKNIGGIE